MRLRIATWNVNSIKVRAPAVLDWLGRADVDVLLLQEIKCETAAFPTAAFAACGYHGPVYGQKTYNGVAVLSRLPLTEVQRGLPDGPIGIGPPGGTADGPGEDGNISGAPEQDLQARYLEVMIGGADRPVITGNGDKTGGPTPHGLRIGCLYLPNGNPVDSAKYPYKLAWMRRLALHAAGRLAEGGALVLGGDFNIIPEPADVYDPDGWREDALFRLESRRAWRSLLHLGLIDAWRAVHPHRPNQPPGYTFWDYQAGRFARDQGLRIDHFLLSPAAADRLADCQIDRGPRAAERASDHTPVVLDLTWPAA